MTETIVWHPASEPPDDDRGVLLFLPRTGIDIGLYDEGTWYFRTEYATTGVTHWAEKPRGPAAKGGGE